MTLATETGAVVGDDRLREIIGLVGLSMAEDLEAAVGPEARPDPHAPWTADALARALIALKNRIGGAFSLESVTRDEIVLVNARCPFGRDVGGRESLCMITSSVFGGIAARAFGRAEVSIDEAIARGATRCRVRVRLRPQREARGEWSLVYHGPERS